MRNIAIVGGGIVGLSSALALQRAGEHVRVLDAPDSDQAASWGNAGHIAVEQTEPLASRTSIASMPRRLYSRGGAAAFPLRSLGTWVPFGLRLLAASKPSRFEAGKLELDRLCRAAMPSWRRLVATLDCPELLRETGHVVLWESQATAATGLAAWRSRSIGPAIAHPLEPNDLHGFEQLLSVKLYGGLRFEGSASVSDLAQLRDRMRAAFLQAGGELVCSEVDRLSDIDAEWIVVAAGFGSAKLMKGIGHRVPLIAERGYHLQAARTTWPAGTPPVVLEDRSLILTRFDQGLRAASFVEFAAHRHAPDISKWERIAGHIKGLGFEFEEVAKWMGARPTFPDYLPAIGRSSRDHRVVYAFGHQHLGLTLGPFTGEIVANIVGDYPLPMHIAPFALERFGA